MKKRVLVTGAAGFIGAALCKRLKEEGFYVTGLDNLSAGMGFQQGLDASKVMNVEDLGHPHAMVLPEHDVIIHLAASFANEKSVDYPAQDAKSNVVGTCAVADLARKWGARLIYAGSSSSYGATLYRWATDHVVPFREDHPAKPHTPYALSKHMGEDYVKLLCPDALILRLFNVFGVGDPPTAYRNAIPKMCRAALTTGTITVYGSTSARDFMHIDTLVDIFVGFLLRYGDAKGTYNVSTNRATYMKTIAEVIAFHTGAGINIQPRRDWDKVDVRIGDNTRLYELFKPELCVTPTVGDKIPAILDYVENWVKRDAIAG